MIAAATITDALSTPLLAAMTLAAAAAWIGLHQLTRRMKTPAATAAMAAGQLAVGTATLLTATLTAQRQLVLGTNWPLWLPALLGAGAVEATWALQGLQRRILSRRAGLAASALRATLAVLLSTMLMQPSCIRRTRQEDLRIVAVLVDDSASMAIADTALSAGEKLRLAAMLGAGVPARPGSLDATADELARLQAKLAGRIEQLREGRRLADDMRAEFARDHREEMRRDFAAGIERVDAALAQLAVPLDDKLPDLTDKQKGQLRDLSARLRSSVRDALQRATSLTDPGRAASLTGQLDELAANLATAAAALASLPQGVARLGDELDEIYYRSLPPTDRARIDEAVSRTREAIARATLLEGHAAEPSLLSRLEAGYAVKVYRFAGGTTQTDAAGLRSEHESADPHRSGTDLTGALERVLDDIPTTQCSGVVILTDGRSNSTRPPEDAARRLSAAEIGLSTVLIGSARPPRDASLATVKAPEIISPGDRVSVEAEIDFAQLSGQTATVRLFDGTEKVDERQVAINGDRFRARVLLSHEPTAGGFHAYRVEIDPLEGEVSPENNIRALPVNVSDDPAAVLLVEGRPRWEFRYLKNLFSDRDPSVSLQYVLLEPDQIATDKPVASPPVPARAHRDDGAVEANALPGAPAPGATSEEATKLIEAEWFKFDTVILGDADAASFRGEDLSALRRFVIDRGGTLIVIAGRHQMPAAWPRDVLDPLLPVTFSSLSEIRKAPAGAAPAATTDDADIQQAEPSFRMTLTAAGRAADFTRLADEEPLSTAAWESLPELTWRQPFLKAKPAAQVLAFAMPPQRPDCFVDEPGVERSPRERDAVAAAQAAFEVEHPLIVTQRVGRGKVLFLATDRTWRMRYRLGDTLHHKFWGQLLLWANANRLTAGSAHVRLGTARARHEAGQPVEIRARLVGLDYTPVVSDEVWVRLRDAAGHSMGRVHLTAETDSGGMYRGEATDLPPGVYHAELESTAAASVLALEGPAAPQQVACDFLVETGTARELADLSADGSQPERLAALTGGVVVRPDRAAEVLATLGAPTRVHYRTDDYALWNSWPFLAAIVMLAAAEWLIAKKAGLP